MEQDNWRNYPLSLPLEVCSPCVFDLGHYKKLWDANQHRLFTDDDVQIKVVEVGLKGVT